jgi:hypothetical protein
MPLFTFITEINGSTLVEQLEAATVRKACEIWHSVSQARPEPFRASLYTYINPTPIEDSLNAWCYGGQSAAGHAYLTNIVATDSAEILLCSEE